MKKIIKNRLYDTNTAKLVGCAYADCDCTSLDYWYEDLYLKKTGEYFLYGHGGPTTKYAVAAGSNNWCSGSRIIPMTYEAARSWAEESLDADEYVKLFGAPAEANGNEIMTISVPTQIARVIRAEAQQTGCTISGTIAAKFA